MKLMIAAILISLCASAAWADMSAQLIGDWDGNRVPAGQQCALYGGNGSTPPMRVSGVPDGAAWIVAYFNDKSYTSLSRDGGHGTIAFPVAGPITDLPSVPGMQATLPGAARVVAPARSTGRYASDGYLPPCSGGKGNRYTVDLKAVDANGQVLDELLNIDIGRY